MEKGEELPNESANLFISTFEGLGNAASIDRSAIGNWDSPNHATLEIVADLKAIIHLKEIDDVNVSYRGM